MLTTCVLPILKETSVERSAGREALVRIAPDPVLASTVGNIFFFLKCQLGILKRAASQVGSTGPFRGSKYIYFSCFLGGYFEIRSKIGRAKVAEKHGFTSPK